jgi:hypothetical protein
MRKINLFVTSLLLGLVVSFSLTSCLSSEDPYRAGFSFINPTSVRTNIYANTTVDSVIVECLGPWAISGVNASWCKLDLTSGRGNAIYSFAVSFEQNTTGEARLAQFTIQDTDHPADAHSSWQYLQYATRGDGSMGNAALVKTITSDDGYVAKMEYDKQSRPVRFTLTNPDGTFAEQMDVRYNEQAHQLTVERNGTSMTGTMDSNFQSMRLVGVNDTVGYTSQYYSNGMQMSANNAFNVVSSNAVRGLQAFSYLLGGKSLAPDSLHTADSLRYVRQWKSDGQRYVEMLKLEYSQMDNRYQSVDVNQLLLGFAECHPMQLLSMFSYARSTSIVRRATSSTGNIDVTTELNPDKSVRRMVVKDARKGTEVTYDFAY